MIAAMAVGMLVGVAIFLTVAGMTFDEALVQLPTATLIVVAFSMTAPMVAWMRHGVTDGGTALRWGPRW